MIATKPLQEVIILGAGTSGLSIARCLLDKGIKPLLLEASDAVAASWRKRHPQLSLNTHRTLSSLPGKAIDKRLGGFIKRDDYVTYVETYAQELIHSHGLEIRFNTPVERIDASDKGWQVITNQQPFTTKCLVVATGTDREPYLPTWNGQETFTGCVTHAAHVGHMERYDNQNVVVVGGANSGIDIANHLCKRGRYKSLTVSMRNGSHLLPTYIAGIPTQLSGPLLARLPLRAQDVLANLFSRLCFGDLTKYGMKTPSTGGATRLAQSKVAPGFDDGFVNALKTNALSVAPEIAHINVDQVTFKDGRQTKADHIICATGYRTGLEKLLPGECVLENDRYQNATGLWVFGMTPKIEGSIYARAVEAEALSAAIRKQLAA